MKVVAIIQARMGSTRLPGKMLLNIVDKPTIEHVWNRIKPANEIDEIWLATGEDVANDPLVCWAKGKGLKFFRGSEDDVLDRYYNAAKQAGADVVVRITGDCPLLDYHVVDRVVRELKNGNYDYVCNTQPPTYPDGLDTEVFYFSVLEKVWQEAKLKSEHEHVTPYIWKHPELFIIKNVENDKDLSNHRWTLDTQEDLELICLIIKECKKQKDYCGIKEILQILERHPEWLKINKNFQRNEGYRKSLESDK